MGGNPLRYIDPTGELLYPAVHGVIHLARIAAPHVARFVASKLARAAIVSTPMANVALLPSEDVPVGGVGSCPIPKRADSLIVGGVGKGQGRNAVTLNINRAESSDVVGTAQALPFMSGSFNKVDLERLPFNQLDNRTFGEAARVLGDGGSVSGITGGGA